MKRLIAISLVVGMAFGAFAGAGLALAKKRTWRIGFGDKPSPTGRHLVAIQEPLKWKPAELAAGERLGRFKLTYYWMPSESGGGRQVQLYNKKKCRPLAKVPASFARKLRLEGGGKLRDGRVLAYSGACRCDRSPCYRFARRGHTWGTGVKERPLSPFRSVAVDPAHIAIGTSLYIPELDGLTMPGSAPWGGFVHDGCVVADDQGGGIRGREIDLFAARKSHYMAIQRRHRFKRITVHSGGERCQSPARRPAARRGAS